MLRQLARPAALLLLCCVPPMYSIYSRHVAICSGKRSDCVRIGRVRGSLQKLHSPLASEAGCAGAMSGMSRGRRRRGEDVSIPNATLPGTDLYARMCNDDATTFHARNGPQGGACLVRGRRGWKEPFDLARERVMRAVPSAVRFCVRAHVPTPSRAGRRLEAFHSSHRASSPIA